MGLGLKLWIVLVRLLVPLKVMQVMQLSYIKILVVCVCMSVYRWIYTWRQRKLVHSLHLW